MRQHTIYFITFRWRVQRFPKVNKGLLFFFFLFSFFLMVYKIVSRTFNSISQHLISFYFYIMLILIHLFFIHLILTIFLDIIIFFTNFIFQH